MCTEIPTISGSTNRFRTPQGRGSRISPAETFGGNRQNGNNDVHWLKVLEDAGTRDVFAHQPQDVPANRVAVPAPQTRRGGVALRPALAAYPRSGRIIM